MKYLVIKQVTLGPGHVKTGKTRHYGPDGKELPKPAVLQIAYFPNGSGFYLCHFAGDGKELTDTFHTTVDDAYAQAEWEFLIKPGEWEDVSGAPHKSLQK